LSTIVSEILVVDDDPDARAMITSLLERVGYQIAQAANGQLALEWLTSGGAPRLILLDLTMPVMSGTELLPILRSYARLSAIPVIVISGQDLGEDHDHTNVVRYFRKPPNAAALLAAVEELVRRR
jgi:CheY-like chemotaxis protein